MCDDYDCCMVQMRQGYMRLQAVIRSRILTARFNVIRGWAIDLQVSHYFAVHQGLIFHSHKNIQKTLSMYLDQHPVGHHWHKSSWLQRKH